MNPKLRPKHTRLNIHALVERVVDNLDPQTARAILEETFFNCYQDKVRFLASWDRHMTDATEKDEYEYEND